MRWSHLVLPGSEPRKPMWVELPKSASCVGKEAKQTNERRNNPPASRRSAPRLMLEAFYGSPWAMWGHRESSPRRAQAHNTSSIERLPRVAVAAPGACNGGASHRRPSNQRAERCSNDLHRWLWPQNAAMLRASTCALYATCKHGEHNHISLKRQQISSDPQVSCARPRRRTEPRSAGKRKEERTCQIVAMSSPRIPTDMRWALGLNFHAPAGAPSICKRSRAGKRDEQGKLRKGATESPQKQVHVVKDHQRRSCGSPDRAPVREVPAQSRHPYTKVWCVSPAGAPRGPPRVSS